MFRNKGALQMGCFLGRRLHCLLPLNIRGPVIEGEGDDRFVLPEKHFITGFLKASPLCPTVCLCVVCLPASCVPTHPLLSPFLCRLEDAQPRKMCDPAAGGHGREGEEPVSPLT